MDTFRETAYNRSQQMDLDRVKLVLVEGESRKSTADLPQMTGRTDTHKRVVFDISCMSTWHEWKSNKNNNNNSRKIHLKPGDYVAVHIQEAAVSTLKGVPLFKTTMNEFHTNEMGKKGTLGEW